MSSVDLAVSSFKPANSLRVSSKMSLEIRPLSITSLSDPSFSIMSSKAISCLLATSVNFSWNLSVDTPAASICSVNLLHFDPRAPSSMLLRASEKPLIIPPKKSDKPVNKFLASSKSPMIICHVLAHPEPTASFIVSNSCVKVLTSVAAPTAVLASSTISLACFSV